MCLGVHVCVCDYLEKQKAGKLLKTTSQGHALLFLGHSPDQATNKAIIQQPPNLSI